MSDSFRDHLQEALGSAYALDRELPGGGMSRVFVARERALDREVVVKVLPPDLAAGVNRERFRREIQLAAQLQHPHIVPLLSAGESSELLYYTMPFIRGESLKAAIESRGALPIKEVVCVMQDVVDALAYAHERGVIHRDIKPANVLMSGSHALITDFGVAKALSASLPISGVTTAGVAIGTPAYMAPEQLAGDPNADHRVDIYAVGLLAYELLLGASPFAGESPQATMAAQLTRVPEPISKLRPDVPPALSRIIERCLAKSAAERPATARDLLAQIDDVPLSSAPTIAVRRGTSRVSRRTVGALTALTTVALVSALAVTLNRRPAAGAGASAGASAGTTAAAVPAPPAAPLAAPALRAQTALSRDDSLAIAKAVQQRVGEAKKGDPAAGTASIAAIAQMQRALADSIQTARAQIYAAVMDSMRQAIDSIERGRTTVRLPRGIPTPPTRTRRAEADLQGNVVVVEDARQMRDAVKLAVTPWAALTDSVHAPLSPRRVAVGASFSNGTHLSEMAAYARAAADTVRARLKARGGYEVLPPDATDGPISSDPMALARATHAGVSVIGVLRVKGDSAYLWVYASDLRGRYPTFKSFVSPRAPLSDPLRGIDVVASQLGAWLERK